jgi:hypothetical protein
MIEKLQEQIQIFQGKERKQKPGFLFNKSVDGNESNLVLVREFVYERYIYRSALQTLAQKKVVTYGNTGYQGFHSGPFPMH